MLLKARDEGVAVAEADALGRGAPYKDDEEAMCRRGSGLSEKEEYGQVNGFGRWQDVEQYWQQAGEGYSRVHSDPSSKLCKTPRSLFLDAMY